MRVTRPKDAAHHCMMARWGSFSTKKFDKVGGNVFLPTTFAPAMRLVAGCCHCPEPPGECLAPCIQLENGLKAGPALRASGRACLMIHRSRAPANAWNMHFDNIWCRRCQHSCCAHSSQGQLWYMSYASVHSLEDSSTFLQPISQISAVQMVSG